jgi:putative ABC transport system substrate-binding protein
LRNSGYVEGQNLLLERRTAEGKAIERTRAIAEDLINRKVDVIVVGTTRLARETKRATNEVPIVMAASVDPVAMGVVPNLARPGGNVTGFSAQAGPEIDAKRLQLLKEAVPKISSVAFLGTGVDREMPNANALRDAAHALGLRLFLSEHTFTDYADAFAVMAKERPEALFVAIQPASAAHSREIFDFVLKHRIPATYPWRDRSLPTRCGLCRSDTERREGGRSSRPATTKFEVVGGILGFDRRRIMANGLGHRPGARLEAPIRGNSRWRENRGSLQVGVQCRR